MGIYVRGMKMPNACYECNFYNGVCPFDGVGVWYGPLRERADGCPILDVPDHGDLVDMDYIKDHWPNVQYFGAPVVIPAERSEDETD